MGPIRLVFSLLVLTTLAYCEEAEVIVETVKHEDDIAYITPDHHPDVYFSDHFDHQVRLFTFSVETCPIYDIVFHLLIHLKYVQSKILISHSIMYEKQQ